MKFSRYVNPVILVCLSLLSLAAGGAKVFEQPQEIKFFEDAGVGMQWLIPVGLLQVGGAMLVLFGRTRIAGIAIMVAGFLFSTVMIFVTGNTMLGAISLLPVVMGAILSARLRSGPT